MLKKICYGLLFSFILINSIYSESVEPLQIDNFKIDEAYTLNNDRSIVKPNWEEVCEAIGLFPTKHPNAQYCVDQYGNFKKYVQAVDVCADGSLKAPMGFGWCRERLTLCPNSAWRLEKNLKTGRQACVRIKPKCDVNLDIVTEEKLLAGIAYGESSLQDEYKEMAGIASATIRRRDAAKMDSVNKLVQKFKNFSYVVYNGNERYLNLMCSPTEEKIFEKAYKAARNALQNGIDYAHGGCFWDGLDLKTKGTDHTKYKMGFRFTDPKHNIFEIQEPPLQSKTTNLGTYNHEYDSTAAHGKTIFWKLNNDFLKAKGKKQCQ